MVREISTVLFDADKTQEAQAVVQALRDAKPWTGTHSEKWSKFREALTALESVYGTPHMRLQIPRRVPGWLNACLGMFTPRDSRDGHTRIYVRKFSVITLLHEFAHAVEHFNGQRTGEMGAREWSEGLFFTVWPEKLAAVADREAWRPVQ